MTGALTASPDTLSAARERARLSNAEYWLHMAQHCVADARCLVALDLFEQANLDSAAWDLADKRIAGNG